MTKFKIEELQSHQLRLWVESDTFDGSSRSDDFTTLKRRIVQEIVHGEPIFSGVRSHHDDTHDFTVTIAHYKFYSMKKDTREGAEDVRDRLRKAIKAIQAESRLQSQSA